MTGSKVSAGVRSCAALTSVAFLLTAAHTAEAGIDVWTSHGPTAYVGSVEVLIIDPTAPSTLYAGTPFDGVFKSTDAGATWTAFNAGLPNTPVNALAVDPTKPSRVYAATHGGVFSIQQVGRCIGDCDDSGDVRVSELVTLMNIGLGEASTAACPNGIPSGTAVDIAVAIQAVDNGLHGCGFTAE